MGCVCFSDFIVRVKVESEFVDDSTAQEKGLKHNILILTTGIGGDCTSFLFFFSCSFEGCCWIRIQACGASNTCFFKKLIFFFCALKHHHVFGNGRRTCAGTNSCDGSCLSATCNPIYGEKV